MGYYYLFSVYVAVRKSHRRVVFVHRITRQRADEIGLGTVSKW